MLEDYTPEQQAEILRMPKAARFGFIYGMSNQKIKEQTGYTVEEFDNPEGAIIGVPIEGWHTPINLFDLWRAVGKETMEERLDKAINLIKKNNG